MPGARADDGTPHAACRAATPSRSARRRAVARSVQPASSSMVRDAPASQSASAARRSVLTCSASRVPARRIVSMSPPVKRRLCSITTSRAPDLSADRDRGDEVAVEHACLGQRARRRTCGSGCRTERPVAGLERLADAWKVDARRLQQAREHPVGALVGGSGGEPRVAGVVDGARLAEQPREGLDERLQRRAVEHERAQPFLHGRGPAQRVDLPLRRLGAGAQLEARLGMRHRDGGELARKTQRELGVGGGERVRALHVVEEDDADHLAAGEHRHGHHRADVPEADGGLDDARVLRAFATITGLRVRSSSSVTPSAGMPASVAPDLGVDRAVAGPADAAAEEVALLVAQVDAAPADADELRHRPRDDAQEVVDARGGLQSRGDPGERGERRVEQARGGVGLRMRGRDGGGHDALRPGLGPAGDPLCDDLHRSSLPPSLSPAGSRLRCGTPGPTRQLRSVRAARAYTSAARPPRRWRCARRRCAPARTPPGRT